MNQQKMCTPLLVIFTFLMAIPALGQTSSDRSKFAVFVDAGVTVPHGDLSPFLDPGFSLNTGLEYMITPQFSAEGTFGYHRFSTSLAGTLIFTNCQGMESFISWTNRRSFARSSMVAPALM